MNSQTKLSNLMKLLKTSLAFFLVAGITLPQTFAAGWSSTPREERELALNAVAGVPELLGLQFSFIGTRYFAAGVGFGRLPIDSYLQSKITLSPIPVSLSSPGDWSLQPTSSYSLTGYHVFVRGYPFAGGVFLQLAFASLSASGSVSASLNDATSGSSISGLISGSVSLTQRFLTATLGYEWFIYKGLFLQGGIGVSNLLPPSTSFSLGGTVSNLLPLVPDAEAAVSAARDTLQNQVSQGVDAVKNSVKVLPAAFLTLGYAFDVN